jgi:hypothetical protein
MLLPAWCIDCEPQVPVADECKMQIRYCQTALPKRECMRNIRYSSRWQQRVELCCTLSDRRRGSKTGDGTMQAHSAATMCGTCCKRIVVGQVQRVKPCNIAERLQVSTCCCQQPSTAAQQAAMTLHGDRQALGCSSCSSGVSCAVPVSGAGARGSAHVEVNLVTALVPSDTACLASSPGRMSRTAVCAT